jgi:restriction system protein
MAIWLTRAGSSGEYERKFLDEGKVYLTWDDLNENLQALSTREDLLACLERVYPNGKPARNRNWASQIWAFAKEMQIGDWVIMPSKIKSILHIGEIVGGYTYDPTQDSP